MPIFLLQGTQEPSKEPKSRTQIQLAFEGHWNIHDRGIYFVPLLLLSFPFFPAPAEFICHLGLKYWMGLVHPEASMEPSIQKIRDQVAQMEHSGVAWWHLSGLGTLPGEGGTPVSPKHQLCASNCCIWKIFLSAMHP